MKILDEIFDIVGHVVSMLPCRTGKVVRRLYYSRKLRRLGKRAHIAEGVQFMAHENISIGDDFEVRRHSFLGAPEGGLIEIGDNVSMASNVILDAGSDGVIRIGNNSGIAHNCVLRSSVHQFGDPARPFKSQGHKPGSIVIEDDVWVSANSMLLSGTHIEKGVVVGASSVVSGTVKAYSIVAGNPARVIGKRGA